MKVASYIQIVACTTLLLGLIVFSMFWQMYQQTERVAKQHFQAQISLNNFSHFVVLSKSWLTTQDLFFSGHQSYLANGINNQSEQLIHSVESLLITNKKNTLATELAPLKREIIESNKIIIALTKLNEPNQKIWLNNINLSDELTSKIIIRIDKIQDYYKQRELKLSKQSQHINKLFKQRAIIIGLGYLFTIFIIAIWMSKSLVKPIESLTKVATREVKTFNAGDFRLLYGPAEIIRLGEAIYQLTEQITLEKKIAQRERLNTLNASNRLSLIMNTVPIAIVLTDDNGIIRDLNPETELLFCTNKVNIRGSRLSKFMPSMATLENGFDRQYVKKQQEETLLSSHLHQRYVEFTGKSLSIDEQRFFLVCISDINDKKQSQEALNLLNNQLIHSEKMASIGELSAGIAHEINNPIGFVNSNIGTLEKYFGSIKRYTEAVKAGEQGSLLNEIYINEDINYVLSDIPDLIVASKEGIDRVINIIKDLGVYSHNESSHKTSINIDELIEKSLTLVANELKHKAVIKQELASNVDLLAHPQKLLQVFINLFVNASHAIEKEGEICVLSQVVENSVIIKVKDNGCGIAKENQSKLFDPFFTTKPVGSGTGLGLHIVHNIVAEHNGKVTIKSEPGKGTTVTIELPIEADTNLSH